MNINDLITLIGILEGGKDAARSTTLVGKYVLVRCRDAGIHAGTLVSNYGRECTLENARRIYSWTPAQGKTLSAVAKFGINTEKSRIATEIEMIILTEDCEIMLCTETAKKTIQGAEDAQ